MNIKSTCKTIDMSIKTIAVQSDVYEKLARQKRDSESFTKTISRLITERRHPTCADAVRETARIFGEEHTEAQADLMEKSLQEARKHTEWGVELPE